jgi:YD repeat-containing protein
MKKLAFLLCLAAAPLAHAQLTKGDAIKATTTVNEDGTRKTLVVNPETQSAEETYYDGAGKVIQRITYPLDARNQPLGAINYNGKGQVIAKSSYKRDDSGRISEETITDASGQFLRRRLYSYSTQNKISRIDEYDANGVLIVPKKPAGSGAAVPDKKKKR